MNPARAARLSIPTFPWRGWSRGTEFEQALHRLVGDRRIEDLSIPFASVVTDLLSGEPVAITHGPLVKAIRASTSVPGLFTPVELEGRLFIDGGVVHPLLVDVVRSLGAEVVAVDVLVPPEERPLKGVNVVAVLFRMATLFQKRLAHLSREAFRPEVLLVPDFQGNAPSYGSPGAGEEADTRLLRQPFPKSSPCADRQVLRTPPARPDPQGERDSFCREDLLDAVGGAKRGMIPSHGRSQGAGLGEDPLGY